MAGRFRVSLPGGEGFEAGAGETLLAAAQRAHWLIRFGCRNGNCEACAATLLAGRIEQRGEIIDAPQPFLLCLARAHSDLQIQLPGDPVHGSAAHARRVYAQVQRIERAGALWQLTFALPAGKPLPVYAGQSVEIDAAPSFAFIENDALQGRALTVFAAREPAFAAGDRVFLRYPLGYAYRVADAAAPLWLLCDAANRARALRLHAAQPGSVIVDGNDWPRAARPVAIHAYAETAATVHDWYRALLSARVPFTELRSDFSILRAWRVCRQDDHGNRFALGDFLGESEARARADDYAARGHKQLYWAEPMPALHDRDAEGKA